MCRGRVGACAGVSAGTACFLGDLQDKKEDKQTKQHKRGNTTYNKIDM